MNLAFISKRWDSMGGTERDLYELARRLAARGHAVHVYCLRVRQPPVDGVHLHRLPIHGPGRLAHAWSLAAGGPAAAFRGGHDLVIAYARVLRADVIRCGGGTHRRYLDEMDRAESPWKRFARRLDPYHRSLLAIEHRMFRHGRYRKIIAISEVVKKDVAATYGVPNPDLAVVYDGVDAPHWSAHRPGEREDVRNRFGISADAPVLLFVGNAFRRKGLDTLLMAMPKLDPTGIHALVVGEDPRRGAYQQTTDRLGLAHRVHFAGAQPNVRPFYRAADLLVLPSLQEAFGNVVLEGMAAGLPVVVSRMAGAAEVLGGGLEAGIMDDPRNADELAARVLRLLEPNLRRGLSETAARTAHRFSLEAHTDAMLAVFEQARHGLP
jgi:UDP-glucose:(heptosyl)LPS alpha-1,3-glucosyltransferase